MPLGGAHAAGGADFVLLHGEHAGQGVQHDDEESGVQDEHDFRRLSDTEPDEEQRDKRDRRNEADEVQKRLRESADGIDFTDDEADRDGDQAAEGPAEQDAVRADADVLQQGAVGEQLIAALDGQDRAGQDFRSVDERQPVPQKQSRDPED